MTAYKGTVTSLRLIRVGEALFPTRIEQPLPPKGESEAVIAAYRESCETEWAVFMTETTQLWQTCWAETNRLLSLAHSGAPIVSYKQDYREQGGRDSEGNLYLGDAGTCTFVSVAETHIQELTYENSVLGHNINPQAAYPSLTAAVRGTLFRRVQALRRLADFYGISAPSKTQVDAQAIKAWVATSKSRAAAWAQFERARQALIAKEELLLRDVSYEDRKALGVTLSPAMYQRSVPDAHQDPPWNRMADADAVVNSIQNKLQQAKAALDAMFGGRCNHSGNTDLCRFWVISPDGTERAPDLSKKGRYGPTETLWHLQPGDLAVSWKKAYTAADHEPEVGQIPVTMTPAQRESLSKIEAGIRERWNGQTGMSGRTTCPPFEGWDLSGKARPRRETGW